MSTVLITGAARGIGLELARQFEARGDDVIAACRTPSPELEALGQTVVGGVEVTDDDSVARLRQTLGDRRLDILVNNAGILCREYLDDLDFDRIRRQFEVNTLGPLRVTAALRGHLASGAKVVIVTSRMGSIGDNSSGGYYGYRVSKAGVNMVGKCLAEDLRGDGITVLLLHPGMVATDMTGRNGIAPAEAASNLIARITELGLSQTGTFHHANGEVLPW
jgi:NAD(P)-dependent dehydrogenase (short-subunit alcohol dehydrogenase family)